MGVKIGGVFVPSVEAIIIMASHSQTMLGSFIIHSRVSSEKRDENLSNIMMTLEIRPPNVLMNILVQYQWNVYSLID